MGKEIEGVAAAALKLLVVVAGDAVEAGLEGAEAFLVLGEALGGLVEVLLDGLGADAACCQATASAIKRPAMTTSQIGSKVMEAPNERGRVSRRPNRHGRAILDRPAPVGHL